MKLIASPTSPFARKARIVLLEKDLPCEVVMDIPWNEGTRVPDYNPLGKIPVLVLDDGQNLFDSRVIAEYLDGLPGGPRLIPDGLPARIAVRRAEALADGIGDSAASIFLEYNKRPPAQQSPEWVQRQQLKVERGLQALARELPADGWLVGGQFSLADIALGCVLGYISLRQPDIDWRSQYPTLAAAADRLESRPSFQATRPA